MYVKFFNEEEAIAAKNDLNGRFYSGRHIAAEFSPVTEFREARWVLLLRVLLLLPLSVLANSVVLCSVFATTCFCHLSYCSMGMRCRRSLA